jgi:UPF0755 protein
MRFVQATLTPRRQHGGVKTTLILLTLLAAITSAVAFYLWRDYQQFSHSNVFPAPAAGEKDRYLIEFKAGSGLDALRSALSARGATNAPRWQWQILLKELKLERKLQAGEYAFSSIDTPRSVLFALAEGRVVQHRLTIVEGSRFAELRGKIARNPALAQSIAPLSDAELLRAIGAPETHPEGLFLADTYRFPRGYSDLELLKKAYWAQRKLLEELWAKREPNLPYATPYEALTMASIIEKETGKASERAEIAGVFVRRLRINMRLQTDPTVIYGMGENYDGNIRKRDLTTDTPYNTYTRYGLPPSPIALTGRAALRAALNPAGGKALYFVAKGDGSGAHTFSETLDAHNAAVQTYLKNLRR